MPHYRRCVLPGATYFFTLTLADRSSDLLVADIGRLRRAYGAVMRAMPFDTLAICVLPDHLHAVWSLPPDDGDYSTRWSRIKAGFSRGLPASPARSASHRAKRERGLWQRRFWEHCIRDETDLQRHVDYIHFNPVRHGLVQRAADWRFSSFHRYVRSGRLPLEWGLGADVADVDGE